MYGDWFTPCRIFAFSTIQQCENTTHFACSNFASYLSFLIIFELLYFDFFTLLYFHFFNYKHARRSQRQRPNCACACTSVTRKNRKYENAKLRMHEETTSLTLSYLWLFAFSLFRQKQIYDRCNATLRQNVSFFRTFFVTLLHFCLENVKKQTLKDTTK